MGTFIIAGILAVLVVMALRGTLKHMKGEGGCCGGSCDGACVTMPEKMKVLSRPVIGQKILFIEGMHCENCKNSIERKINRIEGASCKVDLKAKQAVVLIDREIADDDLRRAVEVLEFQVNRIETRTVG